MCRNVPWGAICGMISRHDPRWKRGSEVMVHFKGLLGVSSTSNRNPPLKSVHLATDTRLSLHAAVFSLAFIPFRTAQNLVTALFTTV